MSAVEYTIEARGTRRAYLEEYFVSIGGQSGGGDVAGEGWRVTIGEENTCVLGSIALTAVILTFHAEQEVMDRILSGFRLKFLSTGG